MIAPSLNNLRHEDDLDVKEAIEEAAKAACVRLDEMFPGWDANGITSNFQGHLAEVLTSMIKGNSVKVGRGHSYTELPKLVITNAIFGNEYAEGEIFLPVISAFLANEVLCWDMSRGPCVIEPDSYKPRILANATDAFTSFEAAAEHALKFARHEELTREQAAQIQIVAVVNDRSRECGYLLASEADTALPA